MIMLALDLGKFNTMCCIFDYKTRKKKAGIALARKIAVLRHIDNA